MDVSQRKIEEIKPYERNAKDHTDAQVQQIAASIKEFGFNQPIVVDENDIIIVGHGRYLAAHALGLEEIPVIKANLPADRAAAYRLADNKLNESEWKMDLVIEELKGLSNEMIDLTGFDARLSLNTDEGKAAVARIKLAERFIVPPMSTLDTRKEYWQTRKRMWIDLGIKSDLGGRDKLKTSGSFSGAIPGYYYFKEKKEKELGRTISHAEMEEKYLHELTDGSALAYTETGGILSIFDPVLAEIMYRWFTPSADAIILDPFAGGSVRGVVAGYLGFRYRGVDLAADQVKENAVQAKDIITKDQEMPAWFVGDSLNIDKICEGVEADMIFSCPPYFDLEVYSEDKKDLSNQDWPTFLENYRTIIKKSADLLKENRFAAFVVSEVRERDGKGGEYRNFVGETIKAFTDAGLSYYNEFILLNAYGSAALRGPRQFNSTRKIVRVHQNVLVFYKGDTKNIKDNFGKLDFTGLKELIETSTVDVPEKPAV